MAWFAKLLTVGVIVFITAEAAGAVVIYGMMNGSAFSSDLAFAFGTIGAVLGTAAFLAIYTTTKTASPIIGGLVGGGLTAVLQSILGIPFIFPGYLAFCGVSAAIGAVAALTGALALRMVGLPVRKISGA